MAELSCSDAMLVEVNGTNNDAERPTSRAISDCTSCMVERSHLETIRWQAVSRVIESMRGWIYRLTSKLSGFS